MAKLKKLAVLFFIAFFTAAKVFSQEYLDDRTMRLTEISTDKTYGYEINNPIKVGTKEGAAGFYLNALKLPTGERIRLADMQFKVNGKAGLEMVVLAFEGLSEVKKLYISKTEFDYPKAPVGFTFKTPNDIPKVVEFSPDSIYKVTACSQTLYSVEDLLLKDKLGEFPKPDKSPEFAGGLDELKKYFIANPLSDEKAKKIVFKVDISFLVTCEGKAGNFQIVTKGRGDLETYSNQILAIVNRMPQSWRSATKDGKAVDSYQVLSFMAVSGQLEQVSYR